MAATLTRRDVNGLRTNDPDDPWHPILLAYALAVQKLRDRSTADPDDPTGWTYQAQVHGMNPNPFDGFRNKCQHFGWFFLPWHRMYLHHFESLIRSVVVELDEIDDDTKETWALPYWDYTGGEASRKLPKAFQVQTLRGGVNPLFNTRRKQLINNDVPMNELAAGYRAALKPTLFTGGANFGGAKTRENHFDEDPDRFPGPLEQTPHGFVHTEVGGDMGSFNTAGFDPIFWLHHANVDRTWDIWLGLGNGRVNPSDPLWLNAIAFDFHDASGAATTMKVEDVLDTEAQLGYIYEDLSGPAGPLEGAAAVSPEPDAPPQLVGGTEQGVQLTGDTTDVAFPISEPAGPLAAEAPTRVYLRLEDIVADERPDVPYHVYLNVPDGDDATLDDHFVGTASLFGVPVRSEGDEGAGLRQVFDITDLYQQLNDAGLWSDQVSVRFVPVYLPEPAGPLAAEDMAPGVAEEPGSVTVGQVGVYFQ